MAKNSYSDKFKTSLTREDWEKICPLLEYRVFEYQEATGLGLFPAGMNHVNSVLVGATGSLDGQVMYIANAYRVDGSNVDQEPYFETYESGSSTRLASGNFHHADFPGRTAPLDAAAIMVIVASGSAVTINFKGLPTDKEGTLEALHQQGLLEGFNYTYNAGQVVAGKKGSTGP